MNTTRESLLERVQDQQDAEAWAEFHKLYHALIYNYAKERGLKDADASDVASECMHLLYRKLPDFEYDRRKGRFRGFLRRIVNNKVADLLRTRRLDISESTDLMLLAGSEPSPDTLWERQWEETHLAYCISRVRKQVSPRHFEIFRLYAFERMPPQEVSELLDVSVDHVYRIKSRIIQRIRAQMVSMCQQS